MEAKIYNFDEYARRKRAKIIKQRQNINTANHPSRKVGRKDNIVNDSDPTPPHGIERPQQYDQDKDN
jgi:hypothetical protein